MGVGVAERTEAEDVIAWRTSDPVWSQALESWLESRGARSANTRRAYEADVDAFFSRISAAPWMVNSAHIAEWQRAMRDAGMTEATINRRLAALSSFYAFCMRSCVKTFNSLREYALIDHNPVARVERARVDAYSRSSAMTVQEARALLNAIDRSNVVGLRDYALIRSYLYTGARNSEIRTLRWGDIEQAGGKTWFRWSGKGGKTGLEELPRPAMQAITAYLDAAGLLLTMQQEQCIFTALCDAARHLPRVVNLANNQPLSSAMVNRIVKRWAKRAGLRADEIHVHTLRHTSAMSYYEAAENDVRAVQRVLHHSNPTTSLIYVSHLQAQGNDLWARIETETGW